MSNWQNWQLFCPTCHSKELSGHSLFHEREDIFAQCWEKGSKASYFPVFDFDPYQYRLYKIKGGTIRNYADKQPRARSDERKGFILWKDLLAERLV
jgi:hypothetical protein